MVKYRVVFTSQEIYSVDADSEEEAKLLAQAALYSDPHAFEDNIYTEVFDITNEAL